MSRNTQVMNCRPEDAFAVLANGWSFANWVVGSVRIRDVDANWPAVGARIHHSVGVWPMLINDHTEVEQAEPPHVLQLKVRAWPSGEGRVVIRCKPHGERTLVSIDEDAVSGPARLIPPFARHRLLHIRNEETLRRLAYLAEANAPGGVGPPPFPESGAQAP
jgi:hypothetical protein